MDGLSGRYFMADIVRITGYSRSTIYRLMREKKIPLPEQICDGGRLIWPAQEFDDWWNKLLHKGVKPPEPPATEDKDFAEHRASARAALKDYVPRTRRPSAGSAAQRREQRDEAQRMRRWQNRKVKTSAARTAKKRS